MSGTVNAGGDALFSIGRLEHLYCGVIHMDAFLWQLDQCQLKFGAVREVVVVSP